MTARNTRGPIREHGLSFSVYRCGIALTLLTFLWCVPASLAQGPAPGDQFRANTYPSGWKEEPSVATSEDGSFVVVWASYGAGVADSHSWSVQGRRYDADGTALGDQFQVNSLTPHSQFDAVVTSRDEGFVVAWTSARSAGSDNSYSSIQGRHFAADGTALGDDYQINTSTVGVQDKTSLATLKDGSIVVVWRSWIDLVTPGFRVMGQRYAPTGEPLGGEFQINLTTSLERAIPSVAGLEDGGFVVVWSHIDWPDVRMTGRRYAADGTPLTDEFEVAETYGFGPDVTGLTDGSFLVSWERQKEFAEARRFRADGSPAGDVFRFSGNLAVGYGARAAAMPEGGFVMVIPMRLPGATDNRTGLRAQLFDADDAQIGSELRVDAFVASDQGFPSVATTADGEIIVAWESGGSFWPDVRDSIKGRRFVAPRFALNGLGGKCLDVEGADPSDGTPVNIYRCHGGENQRWKMQLTAKPQRVIGLEGKCLIPDSANPNDVRTMIGDCDGSEALWQLTTPGHVKPSTLIHVDTGLCLDVEDANSEDGTPVGLFACHGRAHQQWRPAAEACSPDSAGLCLEDRRFRAEVTWRSFDGNTGSAQAVPIGSDDSGLLWFFEAENWEMLIKVLDGCAINNRFWVFGAATTTVEYTLTVTDTAVGTITEYFNPLGNAAAAITDTNAFATCSAGGGREAMASSADFESTPVRLSQQTTVDETSKSNCFATSTRMCLSDNRFSVEVDWRDPAGSLGSGQVIELGPVWDNDTSGMFWFFNSSNWEMLVKVLDACDVNGQFLFLGAATTDVEYTVTVRDTDTGTTWQATNPQGNPSEALVRWFDCL